MLTPRSPSAAILILGIATTAHADINYLSRQSLLTVEANGATQNDSSTALSDYNRTIHVSHPGNPDFFLPAASATTTQRSALASTGITFFGQSDGITGWNSRNSSSASFTNRLTVIFDVTAATLFEFSAAGGDGPPFIGAIVTLRRSGDTLDTVRWTSPVLSTASGTLGPGRYTFDVQYTGSAAAGAPLSTTPVNVSLTFIPTPATAAILSLTLAASRRRR